MLNNKSLIKNSILNIHGRTYLPIRETAELLNLYVVWDEKTHTIKISNIGTISEVNTQPIKYDIGQVMTEMTNFKLMVDGYEKQLENKIVVIDGVSYLPLRETAEILGFEVKWDEKTATVFITSKKDKREKEDFLLPFSDDSGLWGYMDYDGNVIVEPKYAYAGDFSNEIAVVSTSEDADSFCGTSGKGECGYIDLQGKEVIPLIYAEAENFSEGLAAVAEMTTVKFDDEERDLLVYKYIDESGKSVIEGSFYNAGRFSDGYAPVSIFYENDQIYNAYIDINGNIVKKFGEMQLSEFHNGYAIIGDNEKLIDTDFKVVLDFSKQGYKPKGEVENGMICVSKNGMCGIVDVTGRVIVPFEYTYIYLSCDTPILAKKRVDEKSEKFGYIDLNDNVIIPFSYENADPFTNGTAFVLKSIDDAVENEDLFKSTSKISIIDKNRKYIKEDVNVGFWMYITGNEYPNGIRKYYRGDKLEYVKPNGDVIETRIIENKE